MAVLHHVFRYPPYILSCCPSLSALCLLCFIPSSIPYNLLPPFSILWLPSLLPLSYLSLHIYNCNCLLCLSCLPAWLGLRKALCSKISLALFRRDPESSPVMLCTLNESLWCRHCQKVKSILRVRVILISGRQLNSVPVKRQSHCLHLWHGKVPLNIFSTPVLHRPERAVWLLAGTKIWTFVVYKLYISPQLILIISIQLVCLCSWS